MDQDFAENVTDAKLGKIELKNFDVYQSTFYKNRKKRKCNIYMKNYINVKVISFLEMNKFFALLI